MQKPAFVFITIVWMQDLEFSGKNKQLSRVRDEEVSNASNQETTGKADCSVEANEEVSTCRDQGDSPL